MVSDKHVSHFIDVELHMVGRENSGPIHHAITYVDTSHVKRTTDAFIGSVSSPMNLTNELSRLIEEAVPE